VEINLDSNVVINYISFTINFIVDVGIIGIDVHVLLNLENKENNKKIAP